MTINQKQQYTLHAQNSTQKHQPDTVGTPANRALWGWRAEPTSRRKIINYFKIKCIKLQQKEFLDFFTTPRMYEYVSAVPNVPKPFLILGTELFIYINVFPVFPMFPTKKTYPGRKVHGVWQVTVS